jgi:hypothetical protein
MVHVSGMFAMINAAAMIVMVAILTVVPHFCLVVTAPENATGGGE